MPVKVCLRVNSCSLRKKLLEIYDCLSLSIEKRPSLVLNIECSWMTFQSNICSKLSVAKNSMSTLTVLSADSPLVIAFRSLRFLSASHILFAANCAAALLIYQRHFDRSCAACSQYHW